jgi:predicted nucleic acid-binding protein
VIAYIETSAVAKVLFVEKESPALKSFLDLVIAESGTVFSSILLETELRRAAQRHGVAQDLVTEVIGRFDLVEPDRATYHQAGLLGGDEVRSLDAIHVATALRIEAERFVTYDLRQADAASGAGLVVVSPD